MAKVHNVLTYQPRSSESLFFDNNVWMFLFCPLASYRRDKQKAYSNLLVKAQQSRSAIFINSLVLSEFCNQWLRLEFELWRKKFIESKDYKRDFVPTSQFKDAVSEVKVALGQILNITERGSDNFNAILIPNLLEEFGNSDFNDSYYIELARLNSWKIVTDDADFFKNNLQNIEVITANI